MSLQNKLKLFLFLVFASFLGFSNSVFADYPLEGYFISTNMLGAGGASLINSFTYTASGIPAGTSIKVQFSTDDTGRQVNWYNASCSASAWTTLSSGTNSIDLSACNFHGLYFYYKILFVSDGSATPTLDGISISYNQTFSTSETFPTSGNFTSINLLSGTSSTSIDSFDYSVMSLPPNTGATIQFSQDNSTWYSSAGVADGFDTLAAGSDSIDLSGLGWTGANFYYKATLTSDGSFTPELDSITLNYQYESNTAPNIPTLVSPANGTKTADNTPTLSANYSDADVGDVGTTNYGIATSAENCTAQTFVAGCGGTCTGASSETADENEDTTWTPGSSIGIDGTYYWCAQNNDGVDTSNWTSMASFILDTTTPDIVAVDSGASSGDRTSLTSDTWFKYSDTGSDDQVSFSWTDPASVSDDTFYYELTASADASITGDELNTANAYIDTITVTEGTNYFHVRPKNGAATWGTERTFIVKYDKTAPTTDDDFANDNVWTSGNQTITLTPADATAGVSWTKYCVSAIDCDPSTGTAYTVPVEISTEGTSYFRYASQDNAANTQTTVGLTVKVDTTDPTTAADAGVYTFNTWTNSASITATLECADASGSGCSATFYCTDTANTCTPTTAYTVPVAISTSGTSYIRYTSTDNVSNTETTASQTVKIDTTAPVLSEVTAVDTPTTDTTPSYTFSSTEAGTITYGGSCSSATTSAASGNNAITFSTLAVGTYSNCTITVTDTAGNASSAQTVTSFTINAPSSGGGGGSGLPPDAYDLPVPFEGKIFSVEINNGSASTSTLNVVLNLSGGPNVARMAISNDPGFTQSFQEQYFNIKAWTLLDGEDTKTVYVKFFTKYGVASGVISASIDYNIESVETGGIITQIQDLSEQISSIGGQIVGLFGKKPPVPAFPPVEQVVPKEPPLALQGLELMSVNPLGKLNLSPAESDIGFFAQKLPQLESALGALDIDVNKPEDVKKLSQAELQLPGLTQTVLLAPQGLGVNEFIEGIPLANLSVNALKRIPSGIVFARTAGELIDFSSSLIVDKEGKTQQEIRTISGYPMQLVIKPEHEASRVTGLTIYKNPRNAGENDNRNIFSKIWIAALSVINPSQEPQSSVLSGLLVQKFAYTEVKPGIFQANITAPTNEGEYEITTIIEYKDQFRPAEETKLTAIVDPEGYVYKQTPEGKLRIEKAVVSIYWLNSGTNEYELWPASKFLQKNPVVTNDTGKYSFLVPEGTYYVEASAEGYASFKSKPFVVEGSNGVVMDIELKSEGSLLSWFNWQFSVIILLVIITIMLAGIVIYTIYKGRNIKLKK